jgi:transposase
MISLKSILVNAPTALREQLQPLSKMAPIHRCANLRPGTITTVEAATKHTLRSIARRWEQLNDEITAHREGPHRTHHRTGAAAVRSVRHRRPI